MNKPQNFPISGPKSSLFVLEGRRARSICGGYSIRACSQPPSSAALMPTARPAKAKTSSCKILRWSQKRTWLSCRSLPVGRMEGKPMSRSTRKLVEPAVIVRIARHRAFALSDLLVVIAIISVLAAVVVPAIGNARAKTRLSLCGANLAQVSRAILMYADDNQKTFPIQNPSPPAGVWWWYKEQVKKYAGLQGKSSPNDKLFACPSDRGYEESVPFCQSARFDYGSYCFNGVHMPGVPNIAGKDAGSIRDPQRTLLAMEWTAHAPLSWHKSKTGKENSPFYSDAQSLVAFVDGHVKLTRIYYDGMNPAYTREPISGYDYKYGPD